MVRRGIEGILDLDQRLDIFEKRERYSAQLIDIDLVPPLPIYRNILIWGHHIVRMAREMGKRELNCIIIENCTNFQLMRIALELESRPGKYSWKEREAIYHQLQFTGEAWNCEPIAMLVEGEPVPNWAQKVEDYAGQQRGLKELIERHIIDLKMSHKLKELPAALHSLLAEHTEQFSFSERRILLNMLIEIVQRDRLPEKETIDFFRSVLTHNNPMEYARGIRFPYLTSLETKFTVLSRKILGESGIKLHPPPFFEGDSFEVSFSFSNKKGFIGKMKALERLGDAADEFFQLLR